MISDSTTSNSYAEGGTARWMSPELCDPERQDHRRTKHSDCYALGMVIYEVLSGRVPFHQYANLAVFGKVIGGSRPERPNMEWFADDVWELLERCWMPQPEDRPSIEDVLQCLEKVFGSWTPPSLLLADQSTESSFSHGSFDITMESADMSGAISPSQVAPSQPPEKLNLGEFAGITNAVGWASLLDGCCR